MQAPTSEAELVEIISSAIADGGALALEGQGTRHGLGCPVDAGRRPLTPVRLTGFSGIARYAPEELVLTAGAGTPMVEIEAALAEAGQMLPFEPPSGLGTLGGVVATNACGPRCVVAGAARDYVLGVQAVSGRAEAFKAGGQVVKNVTGYDLPRLLTGSFGTLAVMTEISLKVLPRPATSVTLAWACADDAAALARVREVARRPFEASGLAVRPGVLTGGAPEALARLEGTPTSVQARSTSLEAAFGAARRLEGEASAAQWRAIGAWSDLAPEPEAGEGVWRVTVPPSRAVGLPEALGARRWLFDQAGALIWMVTPGVSAAESASLRAQVRRLGGQAMLVMASEEARRQAPAIAPSAALAAVSRRLRGRFDPCAVLNPGRMGPLLEP